MLFSVATYQCGCGKYFSKEDAIKQIEIYLTKLNKRIAKEY